MTTDVIVIGGGPAGIMAAITARKSGNEVVLLEKMRNNLLLSMGGKEKHE